MYSYVRRLDIIMTCAVDSTQLSIKIPANFLQKFTFILKFMPKIKGPRIAKTVLKIMKVEGVYVYPCISFLFCLRLAV